MYRMDTVLSLILLFFEMLNIPRSKVEAHFLKKLVFVTNKCLKKMSKANRKPFEIHSSTRIIACIDFLIFSYILQSYPRKGFMLVTEMHCPI